MKNVVLSAKVMELNIGFREDKVIILMILSNGGLMQIWTFLRKLSLTSKVCMISFSFFPKFNLSNKSKITVQSHGGLHMKELGCN